MTQTRDRRPMVFSRVDTEELDKYQRLADRLFDGNLSLLVRKALREFAERMQDGKERAA